MMKNEYLIVRDDDIDCFIEVVERYLNYGYQLVGQPFIDKDDYLYQAVSKIGTTEDAADPCDTTE
jgi:hypothetical protein